MRTLKSKFTLITCLVFLIIGSLTLIAFYMGTDRIIRDLGTKFAIKHALLEKNKILSVIDREVALALKMADDRILKDWCRDEEDENLRKLAFEALESYRNIFRDKSYFIAVRNSKRYYVYDTKAQKVDITLLSEKKPADRWFFDALQKVDTFILNVDYNAIINDSKVWINAVLKDENGYKIGVSGSGIDISDFINEITLSKDKGISAILVDRAGIIQAHPNREYVKHNATVWEDEKKLMVYRLMGNQEDKDRLTQAIEDLSLEKREVETFPMTLEGKRYLAAVTYMKGIGWYNVVLMDVSQILKITNFLPIIAVVLLSLFLMPLIVTAMLNKIVLRPLSNLTDASRRVSQGEYDFSLPAARNDEIGQLTVAFNTMTATVLDYTRNLENKIQERTTELSNAYHKLQEAQKQIMDSIDYARLIQSSILPRTSLFDRYLEEYFILYMPRDIVGGDFYYFREVGERFLIAVIDCTGHGVPGALITMTVNALLNHIPDAVCVEDPARNLGELNHLIRNTLYHDTSDLLIDKGLDIGLCLCIPEEAKIVFAGAGISLYHFDGNRVSEIKGDRKRIGYKTLAEEFSYTNHELNVRKGTQLYLTTDGILDQAGGAKGFSMGRGRFMEMIQSFAFLPMKQQEEMYRRELAEYRGGAPQRDDILFLGFSMMTGGKTNGDA
ncbi:SpoIIE family protein phosphatase [Desulforhabdus amnigena]|uniref:HAMP domain-containing protein n=1 Tax=Desulforhabdus amnigena TaxID=40218 RepID=A0A9W6FRM2_9BACT|nr:SpoIIE family protein phosphatase [Desulforhabdus amnigena]GLI33139.1 hypothetical protein DAMNIGENAA_05720 [Desulforhabdus amnigena]